jgi:hypothetical protein
VARIARGVGPISRDGEAALVALAIGSSDRGTVVKGVGIGATVAIGVPSGRS